MGDTTEQQFLQWRAATVPGVVQTDLLAHKLIPDPFYGRNEADLQWIGLTDWEYQKEFEADAATLANERVELVFDGLDTFAEVSLNGQPLLNADNMFRRWRVDAKKRLKPGANVLTIIFRSPVMKMLPVVEKLPYHLPSVNLAQTMAEKGIPTDPYTRKAPYHYGWDWGPRFVTLGIWRAVRLEAWDGVRIADLHVAQERVTAAEARLEAQVEIESMAAQEAEVAIRHEGAGKPGEIKQKVQLDAGTNLVRIPLRIASPELWYPAGYGAQERHKFTAVVKSGKTQDAKQITTGLRSIELRREKDQWGKSFTFVVNGVPIFAKGANVIPFDSFLPRVTPAKYRKMLDDARAAHMNMLRVWGGGIYENDEFYDLADELGILIWQDFTFGGALVPGDLEFQENVRAEAVDNVKRLRNHPSVVLWCGNNEVETGWKRWGDRLYFKNSIPPDARERVWQDYVVLFRDVLKSVVAQYSPQTPYWPSSPSANFEEEPDNPRNGDMHYWSVWHALAPIEEYARQNTRFMSEYGFQSFPELATIRTFATPDEFDINSATMRAHQKNAGGNERILTYMLREYRQPKDFEAFLYLSQVQQAEAIKLGAEHFRRLRPRNMGTLYWQLNDVWPVASWSSIDYTGRWKALQYNATRFYADVLISPFRHDGQVDLHVVNDGLQPMKATLRQRVMDFAGKVLAEESRPLEIAAQSSTLLSTTKDAELLKGADPSATFAVYELLHGDAVISRNLVFFTTVKDLKLPAPVIEKRWSRTAKGLELTVTSPVLARHVAITFGEAMAHASDNYFDLLPGESRTITITSEATPDAVEAAAKLTSLTDAFPGREAGAR